MIREKKPIREQRIASADDKPASTSQASGEAGPTAKEHPGGPSEAQTKKGFPPTEECDITARKQAEEALREANQQMKSLFDGARDAIFIVEAETGIIIDVNNEAALLLNRPKETIIGLHHTKLHPPEKADFHRQRFVERTKVPNPSPVEAEILTSDGRLVPVEISARAIELSKGRRAMVALFRDITARKRAEEDRLKLEQQTQRAQRLESLGILAGGIAHDFNNLMAIIFGNIDLAIMVGKDQEVNRYLSRAMRSIDQARGLTRQLITFSKGGAPLLEIAPLIPLIQETVQFTLSGSNVSGRFDMEEGLWPGKVDKGQISQMLTNVVINTKEAMPAGGKMDISAKNITFNAGEHGSLPAGDYVRISIQDRGVGISKEMLPKLFDPFFTTKEMGRGLGLATSYSILRQHGGWIDVESEAGRGKYVSYLFTGLAKRGVASFTQKTAIQRGSGMILVMDDEAALGQMAAKMLRAMGYEAVVVGDGREALDVFEQERRRGRFFKALILDLTVRAGMGGKEALEGIRKMDESVPVFIASGYAADPIIARPRDHGFTDSLAKPFSMAELGAMLERHLQKKP